ncbi:MAG: IPT/TIG domain-containing protein, partial [Blastocatellia bacterium]
MILRESIKLKIGLGLRVITALVIAVIWALSQSAFAQQGGAANYFYDANGRLKAVLSPTGEAAIYEYDPAGNFTSITRRAANELSILEFTPGAGGIGAQVTIYGTGFSDTPSANTVKFNGVTATVSAATKTQLTVNVPSGAATGPINVTNTNGAINSGGNFFVTGTVEFSRQINFGESVDFQFAPPSENVGILTFEGAAGQRVSLVVDDLTCGRFGGNPPPFAYAQISIISPSGAIVATAPFQQYQLDPGPLGLIEFAYIDTLVLPASGAYTILIDPNEGFYPIACGAQFGGFGATARLYDVPPDTTGTIAASGLPTPVSFSAPGQKALLTFNGFNGQRISLRSLQSVTTLFGTDIKIYSPGTYPSGTPIISQTLGLSSFTDATTLTAGGTYTILVDHQFNKTRDVTLRLYDVPPDVAGTIII